MTRELKEERIAGLVKDVPKLKGLVARLLDGERFTLVLGAGCSIARGVPASERFRRELMLLLRGSIIDSHDIEKDLASVDLDDFDAEWDNAAPGHRHFLIKHVIPEHPQHLGGHYFIADLIRQGFFGTVINYNFDPYLENALHSLGCDSFLVLVNGCHTPEFIRKAVEDRQKGRSALPVILKTHGDYYHGVFAFSRAEILDSSERIKGLLNSLTQDPLLILGYSGLDYPFIREVDFDRGSGDIWFGNPAPAPDYLRDVMARRHSRENWIKLPFDDLVAALHYTLKEYTPPRQWTEARRAPTGKKHRVILTVKAKLGLHARAALRIVNLASTFKSNLTFRFEDNEVNGKSVLGILLLCAGYGAEVELWAEGEDAEAACESIRRLFDSNFGEERVSAQD